MELIKRAKLWVKENTPIENEPHEKSDCVRAYLAGYLDRKSLEQVTAAYLNDEFERLFDLEFAATIEQHDAELRNINVVDNPKTK